LTCQKRYLFRLYWFPLKIIYSSAVIAVHKAYHRGAGLYAFFNSLLLVLLILDIYWFYVRRQFIFYCQSGVFSAMVTHLFIYFVFVFKFILLFLYKVATGQLKEVSDTRDLEEEDELKKKPSVDGEKKKQK
jgi:ceramide synthetase